MTLTVLFDLDNTLLEMKETFLQAYYDALGKAFSDFGSPEHITQQVEFAIGKMENNQDPAIGLREVFAKNFYEPLGTTEAAQSNALAAFYQNEYPKLRIHTSQLPESIPLISWCKANQVRIAIATNPLFPETATRQRIEWAGLNPDDFDFFSTMYNFSFTKPNKRYYAECLGRLGWPEGPVAMIGDYRKHDIYPVQSMGYLTYWIHSDDRDFATPNGPQSAVQPWLSQISDSEPSRLQDNPEVNLSILQSTPAVLSGWLAEADDPAFHIKPASDEWDLTEVFWHLADMEAEVYLPQWNQLLKDPKALLTAPDTSQWAQGRRYKNKPIREAWNKFVVARKQSLACIETFVVNDLLDVNIRHSIFSQISIKELISFIAKHDRIHLHQSRDLLDIYKIY